MADHIAFPKVPHLLQDQLTLPTSNIPIPGGVLGIDQPVQAAILISTNERDLGPSGTTGPPLIRVNRQVVLVDNHRGSRPHQHPRYPDCNFQLR